MIYDDDITGKAANMLTRFKLIQKRCGDAALERMQTDRLSYDVIPAEAGMTMRWNRASTIIDDCRQLNFSREPDELILLYGVRGGMKDAMVA